MPENVLKVFTCNIRSILEYAAQVWQDIPAYLSDTIKSMQRRSLRIIFPNSCSKKALDKANLTSVVDRRIFICENVMADVRSPASYDKIG